MGLTPEELARARELVDELDRLVPKENARTFGYRDCNLEATREGLMRPHIEHLMATTRAEEGVVFEVTTESDIGTYRIVHEPTPKPRVTPGRWILDKLSMVGCAVLVVVVLFGFATGIESLLTWIFK